MGWRMEISESKSYGNVAVESYVTNALQSLPPENFKRGNIIKILKSI